jgi:predicted TIM-barrel fold metal-dependent hydrolase
MMTQELIDLHSHVIAPDPVRYPLNPLGGKQSEWSFERPVDARGMRQAMQEAGVTQSVLVQASTCYGHDNRYVQDCVAAYPDQMIGVFSVDMVSDQAVSEIDRWLQAGLSGARVFIAGHTAADQSIRLDDPRGFKAWDYVQSLRIPMCIQIRSDGLDQVEHLLQQFPRVKVLLDHLARPSLEEGAPYPQAQALFQLARYDQLYFKLTTHNVRESQLGRSTSADFVKTIVSAFGAKRIAWGSNFPASRGSLAELVQEAKICLQSLCSADQQWIFSGTAQSIYPQLQPA